MFGYHAATWVKYNQLLPDGFKLENPFGRLVRAAKVMQIEPQKAMPRRLFKNECAAFRKKESPP
jgi:hypothetical protein